MDKSFVKMEGRVCSPSYKKGDRIVYKIEHNLTEISVVADEPCSIGDRVTVSGQIVWGNGVIAIHSTKVVGDTHTSVVRGEVANNIPASRKEIAEIYKRLNEIIES